MIKFFRKIRQNLLSEGKTGKYFKYAIGEIVLVVIGILIALSINNWNENIKAKNSTKTYVKNLIEDIKKDISMYDNQIDAAQIKFKYSKEINDHINKEKAIVDTSAFILNLQSIGRLLIPKINNNTYTDLINTGNLKLINDKNSIDAIRDYYNNEQSWWYKEYSNQLVNGYLPLVVDAIPMHLHEEILTNEINYSSQNYLDKALLDNNVKNYTKQDLEEILNSLKENKEFSTKLKGITRSHLIQIKILGLGKNSASSLLNKLNEWKN